MNDKVEENKKNKSDIIRVIISLVLVFILPLGLLTYTEIPPSLDAYWLDFNGVNQDVMISSYGSTITIWDIASREKIQDIDMGSKISETDYSSSGFFAVGLYNGNIDVLYANNYSLAYRLNYNETISALEFSRAGNYIVAGTESGRVLAWNNQSLVFDDKLHEEWVLAISISVDENYITSSSEDKSFKITNISSQSTIYEELDDNWVTDVEWFPQNNTLAYITGNGTLRYLNPFYNITYFEIDTHSGFNYVHWAPDGSQIYVSGGDNLIASWDLKDEYPIFQIPLKKGDGENHAVSKDGLIAATEGSTIISIWDADGNRITKIPDRSISPFFYLTLLLGIVSFSVLIIEAEVSKRKRRDDSLYSENKFTTTQLFIIFLLGIFLMFNFSYYMSVVISNVLTMVLVIMIPFFVFLMLIPILSKPKPLRITTDGIFMQVSWFEEKTNKKRRYLNFDEIKKIQPEYVYSRQEDEVKKSLLNVTTYSNEEYKLFPTNPLHLYLGIEKIEKTISEAMSSKWEDVYDASPKIDVEMWLNIKDYLSKSYKGIILKIVAISALAYLIPIYLLFVTDMGFSAIYFLLFLPFLGIAIGMRDLMNYNRAMGLYNQIKLYNRLNPDKAILLNVKPADVFDAEDYLKTTPADWDVIQKKIVKDRFWNKMILFSMIAFFTGLVGALEYMIYLLILMILGLSSLLFSFYKGVEIQKMRAKIQRAVSHEIKTNEKILPFNFEIPDSMWQPQYIIRQTTILTSDEKILLEKNLKMDDSKLTLCVIGMMIVILLPLFLIIIYSPLPEPWTFMSAMIVPWVLIIPFLMRQFKRGKILAKHKAIEKYNELIKNR